MPLKKLPAFVCWLFIPCMVLAQNSVVESNTDKLINSFLNCDDQFFQQLAKHKTFFKQFFDLETSDSVAYIPVENTQKNNKSSVIFKKPIYYNGLTIIGYENIFIETSFSGQYYFWGFILDNSIDETITSLNKLNWLKYNSVAYIANAQIYDRITKPNVWHNNPYAIDGVIPRQATIEKSLYLEPFKNNKIELVCSIQGDITNDILYTIRPDMKPINEKIMAERQEMIKAYKLKKESQSQLSSNNK